MSGKENRDLGQIDLDITEGLIAWVRERVVRIHELCLRHPIRALILLAAIVTSLAVTMPDELTALATTTALIVGGYWTYEAYVKDRIDQVRGSLQLSIHEEVLSEKSVLLRATLTFENVGRRLIEIDEFYVYFFQVLPIKDHETQKRLRLAEEYPDKHDFIPEENTQMDWPGIEPVAIRGLRRPKNKPPMRTIFVEPGERDYVFADVLVSPKTKVVRVYGYVHNKKSLYKVGWKCDLFHRLQSHDGGNDSNG